MRRVGRRAFRAALLLGCAGLATATGLAGATPASAQVQPGASFAIPAQPLGDALTQLARESGREIVFSAEATRDLRTVGVRGRGGFEPTLDALLAGTGLTWRVSASGAVIVERGNVEAAAEPPAATEIGEVVVTGVRNSLAAERYRAAVPVDVLSQEDFGRYTGSDAADLMIRIPGVSVSAEGNFAVIRGLSERYNTVTFDGMVLPSSDPERQSVELDQFPSRLLDGMIVYKAFSPEQPGNLSGGGVELRPLRFPDRRILSFSIGASASEDVFTGDNDFLTYETGGHADLWARGSEDRFSTEEALRDGPLTRRFTPERSENRPFTVRPEDMPFGPRASFVYGDSFRLGNGIEIGAGAAVTYDASYGTETGTVREGPLFNSGLRNGQIDYETYTSVSTGELTPIPRDGNSYIRSEQNIALGALANLAVRFNENHELSLTGFTSQTATDRAQYDYDIIAWSRNEWPTPHALDGGNVGETAWRFRHTLNYRERNLSTLALVGDHAFPSINSGQLGWAVAHSTAYQDEPDNRRMMYLNPYGTDYFIVPNGTDVDRAVNMTWRRIEEAQDNLRLSWRQPLGQTDAFFEIGGARSETERHYGERIGDGVVELDGTAVARFDDPGDIWRRLDSHLLGAASSVVILDREISALYFLGGTSLFTPNLTLSGGVRFERTVSQSSGFGGAPSNPNLSSAWHYVRNLDYFPDLPRAGSPSPEFERAAQSDIDQVDFLPALNLTWRATDALTLRLAASETIARPSLREMGNYYTWDSEAERYEHGNALLQLSKVRNLDARAEYRFDNGGFVSLSLFQKEIDNPIERLSVQHPSENGSRVGTWFNNPSTAELQGGEVELRSDLGFAGGWLNEGLGRALSGLTIRGNATYIDAEVRSFAGHPSIGLFATDQMRRLYDQPEWIVNLDATYEYKPWGSSVTISWAEVSEVLTTVNHVERDGRGSGFDEYRDATSRLDLVFSQRLTDRYSLKFTARNLTDPEHRYIRDPDQTGGVEIVDRRWTERRDYSLTLTAEF